MNLILVGFMGSGKSAVGRRLAQRLGYGFLDTDNYIEEQTGRSIAAIFAEEGEEYFRGLEKALAKRLAGLRNYVISTGGGMITTPGNLELLRAAGLMIFLDADKEEIIQRLERDSKRPLLQGQDVRERVENLLAERMPLYSQCELRLPTRAKSVNKVAGELIRLIAEHGGFQAGGAGGDN
ncbi:MAG: shikimate kinase [Deltaproteobacteria bacterium]|nr:shikimate kinase [Deltaproteobacteria bacterium]